VLARLEDLPGVVRAETDFAGGFLRLTLAERTPLSVAVELLASLGYRAESADSDVATGAWYDARSVGELSFVEAGVIADRVLAEIKLRHPMASDVAAALRAAVVDALHACFVTRPLAAGPSSGDFRDACVRGSVAAAIPVVGTAVADDLGQLLDADMRQIHRADPP
jgi:hypothetical protein